MREILFRGKRDDGEWVEGNLFIPDLPNTPTQICIGTNVIRITYDIIPETVGQYTGLTDKNGKKIFEGDIISIKFETDGVDGFSGYSWYETAAVVFSEEKHAWIVVFDDGGEEMYLNEYDDMDDVVVIANIYDNPKW